MRFVHFSSCCRNPGQLVVSGRRSPQSLGIPTVLMEARDTHALLGDLLLHFGQTLRHLETLQNFARTVEANPHVRRGVVQKLVARSRPSSRTANQDEVRISCRRQEAKVPVSQVAWRTSPCAIGEVNMVIVIAKSPRHNRAPASPTTELIHASQRITTTEHGGSILDVQLG